MKLKIPKFSGSPVLEIASIVVSIVTTAAPIIYDIVKEKKEEAKKQS